MADILEIPEYLHHYFSIPAQAISFHTQMYLASHLNPPRTTLSRRLGRLQDWRGLAKELGFCDLEIQNIELEKNPTISLMDRCMHIRDVNVGQLLAALSNIEHFDILRDKAFKQFLGKL